MAWTQVMPDIFMKPTFINSELFARHDATGAFSLRYGGMSSGPFDSLNLGYGLGDDNTHVDENLKRFLNTSKLPIPHTAQQCHSTNILNCDGPGQNHNDNADILITCDPDTAVAVRIADCVPILVADPNRRILAAVHAGWRGTAMRVAERAIQAMQSFGSNPSELIVAIGPAIGRCCFAIGDDTAKQLGYPAIPEAFARIDGQIHADLAMLNAQQLSNCGIPRSSIEHIGACTACENERFFSYRRDQGNTGRHLAVAAWALAA